MERWQRAVGAASAAVLLTCAALAGAQVVKTDHTFGSVDGSTILRQMHVSSADIPTGFSTAIAKVTVGIDFDKYNLDPAGAPYYSDIGLSLTSPWGSRSKSSQSPSLPSESSPNGSALR